MKLSTALKGAMERAQLPFEYRKVNSVEVSAQRASEALDDDQDLGVVPVRRLRFHGQCQPNEFRFAAHLNDALHRRLTFDMSGGLTGAKRRARRPLDGRVRRHGCEYVALGSPVAVGPSVRALRW